MRDIQTMTENVQKIFDMNIKLLGLVNKAVICFREHKYDKALYGVVELTNHIRFVTDAIIEDREYFNLVSTESVLEMLSGIVHAQKTRDYVLLADLLELQLMRFLCNVQELIMNKEDFLLFDQQSYERNIELMSLRIQNMHETEQELAHGLDPEILLEKGYRVEFTSCGQMTLAMSEYDGTSYYVHTNHIIAGEAFQTAQNWYTKGNKEYIVFGFGLGYVVNELLQLVGEDAIVTVYESDIQVLKLCCAFSGLEDMLQDTKLHLVYDPACSHIKDVLASNHGSKVCVFYPSFRKSDDEDVRELLNRYLPWAGKI